MPAKRKMHPWSGYAKDYQTPGGFPEMGDAQNGWLIRKTSVEMDGLGNKCILM